MGLRVFLETRWGLILAVVLCLAGLSPAWGAQVYQVAEDQSQWIITHEQGRLWGIGDPVMARRQDGYLAVGVVEAANDAAALVTVQRRGAVPVVVGDLVEIARDSSQVFEIITEGTDFWVSHPVNQPWYAGDTACVARGDLTVGCGHIVETLEDRARLKLTGATAWVVAGDFVRAAFLETAVLAVDVPSNSIQMRQGVFDKWHEGDRACATSAGRPVGCGIILQVNDVAAAFKSDQPVQNVVIGSWVRGQPKTSFVYQAAEDQSALIITHNEGTPWAQGDVVCAQRKGYEIGCGKVMQANQMAAMVEMNMASEYPVSVGDTMHAAGSGNPEVLKKGGGAPAVDLEQDSRAPTAVTESEFVGKPRMGNVIAGVNYVFPGARYEHALSQHLSLGMGATMMNYPTGGGTLKGTAIQGNVSFYESGWFRGMWIYGALGTIGLSASMDGTTESFSSLMLSAGSGWRWQWDNGMNFGFGVGLNYLTKVKTANVPLDTSNLLPSLLMDIGFSF